MGNRRANRKDSLEMKLEGMMPMQSQNRKTNLGTRTRTATVNRPARTTSIATRLDRRFGSFPGLRALLISGILERLHTSAHLRTENRGHGRAYCLGRVASSARAPSQESYCRETYSLMSLRRSSLAATDICQAWYFDIGAHVKKGQLLAVIATPEVDQQVGQSRSNLSTAEANLRLAEITKKRYEGLLKSNAVSSRMWTMRRHLQR